MVSWLIGRDDELDELSGHAGVPAAPRRTARAQAQVRPLSQPRRRLLAQRTQAALQVQVSAETFLPPVAVYCYAQVMRRPEGDDTVVVRAAAPPLPLEGIVRAYIDSYNPDSA